MSQVENQSTDSGYNDHLIVRHPGGQSEKFPGPAFPGAILRIGRELDNEVILTDPRASRYHAEVRRTEMDDLEIRDLGSANGILLGVNRLEPNVWSKIKAGQTIQIAETRVFWEQAVSSQTTIAMKPTAKQSLAPESTGAVKPRATVVAASPAPQKDRSMLPMMIGAAVLLLLLMLAAGALFFMGGFGRQTEVAQATNTPAASRPTEPSLAQQTVGVLPTDTPTPSGPQLAIPVVEIVKQEIRPILLGALPSMDKGLLLINVRVQNEGNLGFKLSTSDFTIRLRDGSKTFSEAGSSTSKEGLNKLGVIDRFDNLNLTPGGSVPESLIFELTSGQYDLELFFKAADVTPIILALKPIDLQKELAIALNMPLPTNTPTLTPTLTPTSPAVASASSEITATATAMLTPTATLSPTFTPEPTPTATRPPLIPAPKMVPKSAMKGTIAYPVFNGTTFDLYLGKVDGSGTNFYRDNASQPMFSPDGKRIAFHSWKGDSRGLVTMDISGANGKLVANFVEDALPTWTSEGKDIIFLTRRDGDRKSILMKADSNTERGSATKVGEGEYPSIGVNGQMVFKGWGNTAFGLRIASPALQDIKPVTNVEEDNAPALSPDGKRVAFMSKREGQWEIYVIDADGKNMKRLTNDPSEDGLPAWSPDGNAIAFVSNRGGTWAVWVMTPEGDGNSQVFTMQGSPDGFVGTDRNTSRGWAEERISWTR